MTIVTKNEEPGFKADVNELPKDQDGGSAEKLAEPRSEDDEGQRRDEAQQQAAEKREGGYR